MANVTLRYVLCDVFTDRPLDGGPLAVFTNASKVDDARMQRLASEMGLPETAFVLPSSLKGAHARLRIFTPERELPFSERAVIGAAAVIGGVMEAVEVRLELDAGFTPVSLMREGARVTGGAVSQPAPEVTPFEEEAALLAALGLDAAAGPVSAYAGGHLVVPLASREAVAAVAPGSLAVLGSSRACVYARASGGVELRVFSWRQGLVEEPLTASAAGAIAAHLLRQGELAADEEVTLVQGAAFGRRAEIFARISAASRTDGAELHHVEIGGGVQTIARGEFRLPPS